jgi:hypothetical protein
MVLKTSAAKGPSSRRLDGSLSSPLTVGLDRPVRPARAASRGSRRASGWAPMLVKAEAGENRKIWRLRMRLFESGLDLLGSQLAFFEVLLHELLVDSATISTSSFPSFRPHRLRAAGIGVFAESCRFRPSRRERPSSGRGRRLRRNPFPRRSGAGQVRPGDRKTGRMDSRVRLKLAFSRSSLLMTKTRGNPNSSSMSQTFSVPTSTPATPQTRTAAPSTALKAPGCPRGNCCSPGVSTTLILWFSTPEAGAALMEILRSISSGS